MGIVDPCHAVDKGPDTELRRYRIRYCSDCEEGAASCPSESVIANKDTRVALALPAPPDEMWCASYVKVYRLQATWDSSQGLSNFQDNEVDPGYGSLQTEAQWFHVATLPIDTRAWVDDEKTVVGKRLVNEDYFPPSEDLEIVGDTSAGSLVGFEGNNVWFSEKNAYHAWPLKARHNFESEVWDVCVRNDTVFVFTCEAVWVLQDQVECRDAACRQGQRLHNAEPIASRRSCIPVANGGLYITREGLNLVELQGSIVTVSDRAFAKDDWSALGPSQIRIETGCGHLFLSLIHI